jgi:hypothetical protein
MFRRALHLVAGRVQATEAKFGELCGVRIPRITDSLVVSSEQEVTRRKIPCG